MPQKSRKEKERTSERREAGQIKAPVAPAPIEMGTTNPDTGLTLQVPAKPTRRAGVSAVVPRGAEAEFDYSYVYADLRRIAILAVLCFGIMFVLAFVLK